MQTRRWCAGWEAAMNFRTVFFVVADALIFARLVEWMRNTPCTLEESWRVAGEKLGAWRMLDWRAL